MVLTRQTMAPQRCPRCGGPLYRGYEVGEYYCLFCGEDVFVNAPRPLIAERPPIPAAATQREQKGAA